MCGFYYMAREHLRACLTPCRHIFGGTASPNISCRRSREGRHDDTDPLVLHGVLPRAREVVDGCQTFHKAEAIQRLPAEPVLHAETGNVSAVARLDRVLHVIPSGLLVHVHGRLLPVHVGRPLDSHWNHVRLERRRAVAGIPLWRQNCCPSCHRTKDLPPDVACPPLPPDGACLHHAHGPQGAPPHPGAHGLQPPAACSPRRSSCRQCLCAPSCPSDFCLAAASALSELGVPVHKQHRALKHSQKSTTVPAKNKSVTVNVTEWMEDEVRIYINLKIQCAELSATIQEVNMRTHAFKHVSRNSRSKHSPTSAEFRGKLELNLQL